MARFVFGRLQGMRHLQFQTITPQGCKIVSTYGLGLSAAFGQESCLNLRASSDEQLDPCPSPIDCQSASSTETRTMTAPERLILVH